MLAEDVIHVENTNWLDQSSSVFRRRFAETHLIPMTGSPLARHQGLHKSVNELLLLACCIRSGKLRKHAGQQAQTTNIAIDHSGQAIAWPLAKLSNRLSACNR